MAGLWYSVFSIQKKRFITSRKPRPFAIRMLDRKAHVQATLFDGLISPSEAIMPGLDRDGWLNVDNDL